MASQYTKTTNFQLFSELNSSIFPQAQSFTVWREFLSTHAVFENLTLPMWEAKVPCRLSVYAGGLSDPCRASAYVGLFRGFLI